MTIDHLNHIFLPLTAKGANNLKVAVGDDAPADDPTIEELESDDFTPFGKHKGKVKAGQKIRIKPKNSKEGKFVVVYVPEEGQLALADVKVFVRKPKAPG